MLLEQIPFTTEPRGEGDSNDNALREAVKSAAVTAYKFDQGSNINARTEFSWKEFW